MPFGPLAQLAEQGTFNPKVVGSIPTRPIMEMTANWHFLPFGSGRSTRVAVRIQHGCLQTGKAPSILAAWSFRSARSQCP